jgi:hypothetical protein
VHSEEVLNAVLGVIEGAGDAELVGASVARGGLDMHVVRVNSRRIREGH